MINDPHFLSLENFDCWLVGSTMYDYPSVGEDEPSAQKNSTVRA